MLHGIVPLWEVFFSLILSGFVFSLLLRPPPRSFHHHYCDHDNSSNLPDLRYQSKTNLFMSLSVHLSIWFSLHSFIPSPVRLVIYRAHFSSVLSQRSGHNSYPCCSEVFGHEPVWRAVIYWLCVRSPGLVLQNSLLVVASSVSFVAWSILSNLVYVVCACVLYVCLCMCESVSIFRPQSIWRVSH